jgi:hypothetical protein
VVFSNGAVAVVRWNGGPSGTGWEWGSLHPPGSVQMAIWLAPTFEDLTNLTGPEIARIRSQANLSIGQYRTLIHLFDASNNVQPGTPQYGHPVLIPSGIKPGQSAPGFKSGSEAKNAGISLPGIHISDPFGAFGNVEFWEGLGLCLAGLIFIILGLRNFA